MGLKGSVRALSLDQLLEFLSSSGQAGTLKINFKDKKCVLCLKDAAIYIDKRGTGEFRLGEILVQRGFVDAESVDKALEMQKKSGARIGDILVEIGATTSEKLDSAFRAQLEEELYDLFVLEDAYFEFERGHPEGFQTAGQPAFPIRSILMEAARRFDEWRHIKDTITSRKCFYTLNTENPNASKQVSKSFGESGISDDGIFGRERSVEETLPLLQLTQFQGLQTLAHMISDGTLVPFTRTQLENRFREYLVNDLGRALKYYECALELDEFKSRQRQLDRLLFQSDQYASKEGWKYSASVKGKRALMVLLSHYRHDHAFEFYAREDERELRILFSTDCIVWRGGDYVGKDKALELLKSEKLISRADLTELKTKANLSECEAMLVHGGRISEAQWREVLCLTTLDAVFDLIFWKNPFIQIQTGEQAKAGISTDDLILELNFELVELISDRVKEWERVTQIVPSVRSFFELTSKGEKAIDSPASNLRLFDSRRTLEQILRLLRQDAQKFFGWLHEQHRSGRVRALEVTDYRTNVETAIEEGRIRDALGYCVAAIDSGWQVRYFKDRYQKIIEQYGQANEERQPAKLEGDLASFSLAEVLQSFFMSKRSGTLRIFVPGTTKEKEIYFDTGQVFLLEIEDDTGDFLLDAGFMKNLNSTFEGNAVAQGLISENELSEQLAEQIKEGVYDVFLWDAARFEFTRDLLPPEFYETSTRVTKYSLNTGMFLLEAISRIEAWDRIREIVPTDELVVKFDSYETKMRAVTDRGNQEVLLLIDGRHTIIDILRISGARRFHAVQLISELLTENTLAVVDEDAAVEEGSKERAGEVNGESFVEVLKALAEDKCHGVLRVTDGRRSKECVFVQGHPHRTDPFKHGTGDPDIDAELSTRFFARDFAEILVFNSARYQLLVDVLPPILEDESKRVSYRLKAEDFFLEFVQAGKRWQQSVDKIEREKILAWRDESDARREAASVPAPANVLDWIDGKRTAEDIIRVHPDGRYLSFMSLAELVSAGVLIYAEPEESDDEDWDFGLD